MKKFIAALLACMMILSLAACGGTGNDSSSGSSSNSNSTGSDSSSNSSDSSGSDSSGTSSAASDMKIAMITDSGDITDQSFNQMTYETAKSWSEANGASFTYYKPSSDADEARSECVDLAAADGANIIIMPGYLFARTLVDQTPLYPDIKFIALDMSAGDILAAALGAEYDYVPENWDVTEYYNTDNTYCAIYQEEISGFMAGYAAVKLGYRHLGFLGGMSVPAVQRYGYGYVQGVDMAAEELGVSGDVTVEFIYGGAFSGDADITAAMDTWYNSLGVEIVFACGGGIYTSAAEAAAKVGGKVIGVDSDQAPIIDSAYGEGMTVTSAMKGLDATVKMVLTAIMDGEWSSFTGKIENLGMVSDDPSLNYVQLPRASTQYADGEFTDDDYLSLVKDIHGGTITISNDISAMPSTAVTVNEYGNIK